MDTGEGAQSKYNKFTIKNYAKFRLLSVDRRWGRSVKFILMMFDWIQKDAIFSYQRRIAPLTTGGRATRAKDILERSNNGESMLSLNAIPEVDMVTNHLIRSTLTIRVYW